MYHGLLTNQKDGQTWQKHILRAQFGGFLKDRGKNTLGPVPLTHDQMLRGLGAGMSYLKNPSIHDANTSRMISHLLEGNLYRSPEYRVWRYIKNTLERSRTSYTRTLVT